MWIFLLASLPISVLAAVVLVSACRVSGRVSRRVYHIAESTPAAAPDNQALPIATPSHAA